MNSPFPYLFALSLHSHTPCACPLTRDKPCPCPPLTPAVKGGGGPLSPTKAWMAQGSTHSLGEQEIFVPGGEGWREREGERDTKTAWAYILFITLCNMHQKNWYPKKSCWGSEGMCSSKIFSSWIRGQTNSLSELSWSGWWNRKIRKQWYRKSASTRRKYF